MSGIGRFKTFQKAAVHTVRNRGLQNAVGFCNPGTVEHWRDGKHFQNLTFHNGVTNEGLNDLLDHHFDLNVAVTAWHMGLIDLVGYSSLAVGDTYDNIDQAGNNWDEYKNYTVSASTVNRGVWAPDPASGQSISNTTQVIYDIVTPGGTAKGLFVVGHASGATANSLLKGDHASDGILWATALFDQGDTVVVNGDQLKITYTVSAS
jgi:hypothetical protein